MASPAVTSALTQIESASTTDKPSQYSTLLQEISSSSNNLTADLNAFARTLLYDTLGIVVLRPLLAAFVSTFKTLKDPDTKIDVGEYAVSLLHSKGAGQYEEADTQLKHGVADAYEENEDWRKSAQTLSSINLESTQKSVSADEKAKVWIRIVRCYLEEDDPTSAFTHLNKIKNIIHDVADKETRLMFKLSQARIYDSQRAFLDAAQSYHIISLDPSIHEDERLQTLAAAIICAVLAPAGPLRGRMLAKLYKDDRAPHAAHFAILEKMYLDRLITPDETGAFAAKLSPHHLAKTADGATVLEKAVLEHNLLAASRLYANIPFAALGSLLGVGPDSAEAYAAKMLEQGRLAGYIDQIERLVWFEGEASGQRKTGQVERVGGGEVRRWDASVAGLAEEVERVASAIQSACPEFYAAQVVH